jgi:hypothetical protein
MLAYVLLADVSREKRQLPSCDRFLVLAGLAACRAGWPAVAARCRDLVLEDNPLHLLGRFDTLADALRDADFAPFARRLDRFCNYEQAEHWLSRRDIAPVVPAARRDLSPGAFALSLLSTPRWSASST